MNEATKHEIKEGFRNIGKC